MPRLCITRIDPSWLLGTRATNIKKITLLAPFTRRRTLKSEVLLPLGTRFIGRSAATGIKSQVVSRKHVEVAVGQSERPRACAECPIYSSLRQIKRPCPNFNTLWIGYSDGCLQRVACTTRCSAVIAPLCLAAWIMHVAVVCRYGLLTRRVFLKHFPHVGLPIAFSFGQCRPQ